MFIKDSIRLAQEQADQGSGVTVPSPIIDLPFNGNSNDISSFSHAVTENNSPTFGTDGSIQHITFNGSNQAVEVASSSEFTTDPFTWEIKFRVVSDGSSWRCLVENRRFQTGWRGFYKHSSNGKFQLRLGSGSTEIADFGAYKLNVWKHFVLCWDGTTLRVYKDGAILSTHTPSISETRVAGPIKLGGNLDGSEYMNADVDFFKMYNVSLTEEQALSLFD